MGRSEYNEPIRYKMSYILKHDEALVLFQLILAGLVLIGMLINKQTRLTNFHYS